MIETRGAAVTPRCVTVTGASGFIGGWVLRRLQELLPKAHVRVLVRDVALRWGSSPAGLTVFPGDLAQPSSLFGLASGSQLLLHCASYVGPSPQLAATINAQGTEAVVAEARRAGVAHIVYVSTAGVYGRGPFTRAVPEATPINPGSPASATRLAAEHLVRASGGTVLRPNLVYGAGDRWVGPRLARLAAALGERTNAYQARISMIDVRRLADAAIAAGCTLAPTVGGRVYDCNHPRPVAAHECLTAFGRLVKPAGAAAALPHDEAMVAVDHWFDSRRVWDDFHLSPGPPFSAEQAGHALWYRGLAGHV